MSSDRGHLLTEQPNPKSIALDLLETAELVRLFVDEDRRPQSAVAAASDAISAAVDGIASRLKAGGRLFYLGAGTSGRLGVLDAAECPPTFCSDPEMVQGVLAGGASALLRSSEGLEDLEAAGHEDLDQRGFNSGDCLVGIAAGGTTPYVRGGLRHARDIGALAIAMACVPSDRTPPLRHRYPTADRAGTAHRLNPTQGRNRHQNGLEHHLHRRHGSVGQGVRQPHGGCVRQQQQTGRPLPADPAGPCRC